MSMDQRILALFQKAESLAVFLDEYRKATQTGQMGTWSFDNKVKAWIREMLEIPISGYDAMLIKSFLENLKGYHVQRDGDIYWVQILEGIWIGVELSNSMMYLYERLDCPK